MAKENITREQLAPKAKEMMDAHGLSEVFICTDEQGFTALNRAENHSHRLADKTVHHFVADKSPKVLTENTTLPPKQNNEEREQLFARYEELFGKKPAHNIGSEKLKASIEEKEAELTSSETNVADNPLNEQKVIQESSEQKTEQNPAETKED